MYQSIILVFGFLIMAPLKAFEGGSSSGGGNFREIEFYSRVDKIILVLSGPASEEFSNIVRAQEITHLANNLDVQFTNNTLFKDGVIKDALNFPIENRIIISESSWDSYQTKPSQKDILVFHELLGILQLSDTRYSTSLSLLKHINKFNQSDDLGKIDFQIEHIEGIWTFNSNAHVMMKTTVIAQGPDSFIIRVQSCDRAHYLHSLGECRQASDPSGYTYKEFTAPFSDHVGRFMAPNYFSLRVDSESTHRLIFEQDKPDGSGLSYMLKRLD